MKELGISLTFRSVPPILLRRRQALILVRDQEGNYILGIKKHYPSGISRMVGGGIDDGEDPHIGAARELEEELGLKVELADLKELAVIRPTINVQPAENSPTYPNPIEFETWVYFYQLQNETIAASDDLDDVVTITADEYQQLVKNYTQLDTTIHPKLGFSWADYGQYYSFVHEVAFNEAQQFIAA